MRLFQVLVASNELPASVPTWRKCSTPIRHHAMTSLGGVCPLVLADALAASLAYSGHNREAAHALWRRPSEPGTAQSDHTPSRRTGQTDHPPTCSPHHCSHPPPRGRRDLLLGARSGTGSRIGVAAAPIQQRSQSTAPGAQPLKPSSRPPIEPNSLPDDQVRPKGGPKVPTSGLVTESRRPPLPH